MPSEVDETYGIEGLKCSVCGDSTYFGRNGLCPEHVSSRPDAAAPPSDAAQPDEVERWRQSLTKPGRDIPLVVEDCGCRWLGLWVLPCFEHIQLFAHPEDAPEGPWEIFKSEEGWNVTVPGDFHSWTEKEAIAVRDLLNRLKGDKADG